MPDMQRLDTGDRHEVRSAEEAGVCEQAPLLNARVRHRQDWPFLYSCEAGHTFINRAPRTTRYQDASQLGEALL